MKHIAKNDLNILQHARGVMLLTVYLPLAKGVTGHKYNTSLFHKTRAALKKRMTHQQHAQLRERLEHDLASIGYDNTDLGYVLFADGERIRSYTLPFAPEEQITFTYQFVTNPIEHYFASNTPYFVLAISSNGSKLFKGDMEHMEFVPVAGLGQDVETTLRIDEKESHFLQNHPAGYGRTKQSKGFHGHGGLKDIKKTLYEEYIRKIDASVVRAIRQSGAPLVLVAVEYGQSVYRHISKYPHIFMKGLTTNPDDLSAQELHKRVVPLLYGT